MQKNNYTFTNSVWLYPGKAAWHFITVPESIAKEIAYKHYEKKGGFGSFKVSATIGSTTWDTSIFPERNSGAFLLPIKKSVREAETITADSELSVSISVQD